MDALRLLTCLGAIASLCSCSSSEVLVAHSVELVPARETLLEEELLDIAVRFDPGIPDGEIPKEKLDELIKRNVHPHVRRAEAIQMAVELRNTLERSGQWGGVWVAPRDASAADVEVRATIVQSDGFAVRVDAQVVDAAGRTWIDKSYQAEIAAAAYNRQRYALDPYQDLFNEIANDLAEARAELTAGELGDLRWVGALRYAHELSPLAFDGYVEQGRQGRYEVVRLPAADDPLFRRTEQVRDRERLFLETLGGHYDGLVSAAQPTYDSWRETSREESIAVRELTRAARWRKALGIAAVLGGMATGGGPDFSFLSMSMISIGGELASMGAQNQRDAKLHAAELEEVSASYDAEIAPSVVEIGGVQRRLIGTAQVQYAELRALLEQMFLRETGFMPPDREADFAVDAAAAAKSTAGGRRAGSRPRALSALRPRGRSSAGSRRYQILGHGEATDCRTRGWGGGRGPLGRRWPAIVDDPQLSPAHPLVGAEVRPAA